MRDYREELLKLAQVVKSQNEDMKLFLDQLTQFHTILQEICKEVLLLKEKIK